MSKNIFKRFFAVAIALLVLSAQINMPVSAFTGENDAAVETGANQEESAANADEQEAATDDAEAAGEAAAEAVEPSNGATTVSRSLLRADAKPFATFDGQDLSAADNSVTYQNYTSTINSQTLEISAPITDSAAITSHQLVIRIENGFAIESGPGLKSANSYNGNTVNWTFDSSRDYLADDLQGKIIGATWTPDPVIKGFYQPASGTLTYDIAPGTTAINLSLAIKTDIGFNLTDSQISYTNPITVQKLENGSVVTEEKLESYTINGLYRPVIYSHSNAQTMYVKPGEAVQINNFLDQAGASVPLNQYKDVLYEEITFTWKIDKNAGIQGIKPNGKYNTSNMIVTVDRTSDSQYDFVAMTLDKAPVGNQYFSFQFQPPADAPDGTYQLLLVDSKTKLYGHSDYVNYPNFSLYPTSTAAWPTVIVSSSTASNVALASISGNTTFAYNPLQDSDDIVPLGGFSLTNLTPNNSTAQNIQMKFDDASYGVKAVRIAFGAKATNIVITTNKGQTFTIDELTGTYNSARKIRLVNIVLANLGTVAADEYITDITYTADSIPAGTNAPDGMNGSVGPVTDYYAMVLQYYGHMISRPATNKFTATASIVESDKAFTDASAKHATNTMTVANANKLTFSTSESFSSTVKSSGTIVPLSMKFNKNTYTYSYDTASVVTGFEIYLREGEYLIIDQSSIKVTWGNEVYTAESAEMTVTPTTDNTGSRVYKLTLPEVKLGSFDSALNAYPAIQVDYSVKIKPTAPTTSIPSKDIAQILPMNGMNVVPVGGNGGNNQYNNANIFNVDGSGDTTKAVGTPTSTTTLKIQAQKSFTVTSAANLNDGPWVSYDYITQKEIINLNPEGNAKYQLTVTNNSGQTIDGYTALVPIPKAGEATDLMPDNPADFNSGFHLQKTPFEWTVSLLEELNTDANALNYQVLYATSYETNKDSSEFVSWDSIADKNDIRMVKITTTDSIADGTNDVIEFPLALTDPNAEANAGKTNIYSARIHRVIDGSAGYNPSEPVAIRLKTGVVLGTVFNDTNRNGIQDADEVGRNGVTVRVYEAGTSNLLDTVVSHEQNGVDGVYEFYGLDKNQNVDIVFTNPNTDDSTRFSPVVSGGSTPTATSDHKTAKTANVTPSSAAGIVVDAGIITPTTVTMNAQGGSTAETTIKKYPGAQIDTEPAVSREGYTFNGWFTASTGGTKVVFPYTVGTADLTLYAQYTVNQYTLTFDIASNGGEGTAPASQTINYGNKASAPATPVKTGYTFTGWYDAATNGNKWDFNTNTMPAANTTLYAQFTINNYTLTFNNDGSETTESIVYGSAITEPTAPNKTGYTFTGWYDAASGGNKWDFTTGTMPANDMTLYAQYTVNQYTLNFDIASNGGEGTEPAAQTINYGTKATAPADAVKTGYTFTGWYDAATAGNKWDFDTNTMPAANTTLYAQFSINSYTVTFDNEGVTTTASVAYNALVTEPTTPVKTGYTFNGWYTASSGGTKWDFSNGTMPANDMTLYAQYTINSYLITYNNQGAITTELLPYNSLLTEPTAPTKSGYTFTGWFTQASGGTQWNFATSTVPAANVTLYAQFSADDQTITFDVNSGNAASKPADVVQPTDSSVNLDAVPAPTKDGYTFIGWFDASDVQHSGTIAMPVGGLNLFAHWTAAEQVITFNSNGGSGVASITAMTDTTIDLDTVSTTRAGYQFDGWFIGGTQYSGIITVPAGGLTFTAHWTALDQTINFDTDGAGTIASITAPTDSAIDLNTITAPSKFAYKFLGWFDANGVKYSGTIAMPAGGLQLQARWQDLIAEGIWTIKANNIELSLSELNSFIDNGTLEQEILNRANATAWDADQNAELSPLHADTSVLIANATIGDHLVTVTYPEPVAPVSTLMATTNAETELATTITVSVTDDTVPSLPITGQNMLLNGLIGGIMAVAAVLMVMFTRYRSKE